MAGSSQSSSENVQVQESSPSFAMRSTIKTLKLKFPSVKNITTRELSQWMLSPQERTIVFLDSRPEEEYAVSHIEGAIRADYEIKNVEPLTELCQAQFQDQPQPTIVCYCSLGYRSSALAEKLQKHFKNPENEASSPTVYNLEGSLFQWANERRPMVDSLGNPTIYVHPYSAVWGMLLAKDLRRESP